MMGLIVILPEQVLSVIFTGTFGMGQKHRGLPPLKRRNLIGKGR
jgi:hypothetical protein